MIKVQKHGNVILVANPVTGKENRMINVVFIEEGRSGGDQKMSGSSDFLSSIIGEQVGLSQLRVHTQPVLADKIDLFPIGAEFDGHINRGLYSTPQLRQQEEVEARIIDGKPTYFKTWLSDSMEEDLDARMSNDVLVAHAPDLLFNARVGAATVRILERAAVEGGVQQPSNSRAI